MNAFRILFLVIVLAGSVALALARVTPSVVENQTDDALAQSAALESVVVAQMERNTRTVRASTARLIAADARLARSLSDSSGAAPSPTSMFRQATNAVVDNPSTHFEAYILTDRSGRVVDATSTVAELANDGLAASARAPLAISDRTAVNTYFEESGRLFGAAAAPIVSDAGAAVGAVVLIEEYDDAMAASMRSGTDANTAFFVGRSVMGSNVGDAALREQLDEVISRTSASTAGSPGRLLDRTRVDLDDRRVFIAPIRLAEPGTETADDEGVVGVAVMTSGPIVPSNLPAVLARFRAFDEGTTEVWIVIGVGLLFFFLALTLLERALAIPVGDMSRRIRDNATANDPRPLPAKRYPAWVRDAAEAYNVFLDAYRAQTPSARSKRAESHSAAHLFMVDNAGGSRPIRLPSSERSGSGLMRSGSSGGASSAVFDAVDEAPVAPEAPVGLLKLATGERVQAGGSPEPAAAAVEPSSPEPEPIEFESLAPDQMFEEPAPVAASPSEDAVAAAGPPANPQQEAPELEPEVIAAPEDVSASPAPPEPPEAAQPPPAAAPPAAAQPLAAAAPLAAAQPPAAAAPPAAAQPPAAAVPPAPPAAPEPPAAVAAPAPEPAAPAPSTAPATPGLSEILGLDAPKPTPTAAETAQPVPEPAPVAAQADPPSTEAESGPVAAEPAPAPSESSHSAGATLGLGTPDPLPPASPPAEPVPAGESIAATDTADAAAAVAPAQEPQSSDEEDADWAAHLDQVGAEVSGSQVAAASDSAQQTRPAESASTESATSAPPPSPPEPAVGRTMLGVKFDTGQQEQLASGFQPLRGGSTPSDVRAVSEPSAGADASGIEGLFDAIAPAAKPAPTPQEPTPEAEKEGQIGEEVASQDPQQSTTVPRVSLEELNRRAQGGAADSGDQDSLLAAAEARLLSLRPSDGDASVPEEHRALFDRFVSAKRECGEDTTRLTYQRFVAKLDRNRSALMSRYECSDVRFDVATKNGKVTLKATPLR